MKLATREFGKENTGKDVILIHGTGARAEMWAPQIELLVTERWHCLVPDLRGHGESHEPGEKTDLTQHINDLIETVSSYEIKWPAVFVGHSLGAIISMELAAIRPELVSRILAVALPAKVPQLTRESFRLFLSGPYQAIKNSPIHRSLAWRERVLLDTNHYSLTQILENFSSINYLEQLPAPACPVHFAVGRLDPVAPSMHVTAMHKRLPGSSLTIFEWAGHNCMDSQPAAFNRWLMEKISR